MTKMMKPLDIVSKPLIYKGFRNCRTSALSFRQKASSLFHALYCAFLPTVPQDIVVCPPSGLTRYCNPLCNVPLILCLSPLCLDHILCPCHLHTPPAYSTCTYHGSALSQRDGSRLDAPCHVLLPGSVTPTMGRLSAR